MFKKQRGISLFGVMFFGGVIVFLAIGAMKIVPAYIEHNSLKKIVIDATRGKDTPQLIRATFDKYLDINQIDVITSKDLQITKDNAGYTATFKYTKSIELSKGIRLEIDFAGSSKD